MKKIKLMAAFVFITVLMANGIQKVSATESNVNRAAWGNEMAIQATKSFNNQNASEECVSKPDYYCNGLMVSAFENGEDTYWMHQGKDGKASSVKRLALTYFRKDFATKLYGNAGFILFPQVLIEHALDSGLTTMPFNMEYKCMFPLDGNNYLRDEAGCGKNQNQDGSAPCPQEGVSTAKQWIEKYIINNEISSQFFCGFPLNGSDSENKTSVQSSIDSQKYIIANNVTGVPENLPWNEVVMLGWADDAPSRVPVMALFYIDNGSAGRLVKFISENRYTSDSLALAKTQQASYYAETGIFIPVLKVSIVGGAVEINYLDEEQSSSIPSDVNVYPQ